MRITTIGFGYVKSLGNYENCKVYLEAKLEPGEDPEESMTELRNRVAKELDLPDQWHDLKGKFARQLAALGKINANLERAEKRWKRYAAFLAAHGVNPDSITINGHPDSIAEADEVQTPVFVGNEYDGCFDDDDDVGENNDEYWENTYLVDKLVDKSDTITPAF